jgi:cyclopropane-fatty-acyl-phospholipid synthase
MALRAFKEVQAGDRSLAFVQELLRGFHPRNFCVELWDGRRWEPESGQFRRFTWKINRPGALRSALTTASLLGLAEAYIYGDFDLDGDIEAVFPLADYLVQRKWSKKDKLRLGALLLGLPSQDRLRPARPGARLRGRVHSRGRDRDAVRYHYDVSNDFYALWLDKEMVYSCAYFTTPEDSLDAAQEQKLDYICRKLRLQPGERLLDIGCGWGGLILHAARYYGVNALGITLSEQQLALAKERIQKEGLSDRCEACLLDYRDVDNPSGYDKLVSVGMVEHVGKANLSEYFRRAFRLLRPGGVFLNHGIGVPEIRPVPDGPSFVDLYVFPDGEFVPVGTMTRAAEQAGFEVRDVENLREHYALTLKHWVRGIEEHAEQARRLVDEVTYRIWRLHMAGSAYYFERGRLDLYQTLLVKSEQGQSGLPLTREDWYAG